MEKCFDCGGLTEKQKEGDYQCKACGIFSKDNKEPYGGWEGIEGFSCPLCGEFIPHEIRDGVHTWICNKCPFVGIEKY